MAVTTEPRIFRFLGGSIDQTMNAFVQATANDIILGVTVVVTSAVALYFVLLGYMMIMGKVQEPASHFLVNILKFVFIAALALNGPTYFNLVVSAIQGLEVGLADLFTRNAYSGPPATSVYHVIDKAMGQGFEIAADILEQMSNRSAYQISLIFRDLVNAVVVVIATLLLVLPAGAMIIVAKAMLAIMLAVGPVFIVMLMFGKATTQLFDRWLTLVLTYIFQIALINVVLALGMQFFKAVTDTVDGSLVVSIGVLAQIIVVAAVVFYLLQVAYQTGGQLAGGIATSGITLQNLAKSAASPWTHGVNRQSTRRDMQSGLMVTAGRTNHLAAGNSIANPAYRQNVMKNLGKNWGSAKGGKIKKS